MRRGRGVLGLEGGDAMDCGDMVLGFHAQYRDAFSLSAGGVITIVV
jgi:hypothetical protein